MLTLNQTIKYLEINVDHPTICSTYLTSLTTGLSHNTNLQELGLFIPVSDTNNEQIGTFFNVISQKNHLTELKLDFILDMSASYSDCKSLLYEQVLPLFTNMLELHTTIRLLEITYH